jgi:phosphoribosylformylglycinamidine cyclo-ligase
MEKSKYEQRGVSSDKKEVHAAIASLDKGLFPGAFCNIYEDVFTS